MQLAPLGTPDVYFTQLWTDGCDAGFSSVQSTGYMLPGSIQAIVAMGWQRCGFQKCQGREANPYRHSR